MAQTINQMEPLIQEMLQKDAPQVTILPMAETSLFALVQNNQSSFAHYFVADGNTISDWPANMTSAGNTVYSIVTIIKYKGVSYVNVLAVTNGGVPHRIDGYVTGTGIIWGNFY